MIKTARVGRNDPCPCESGKKYKKCCGSPPAEVQAHPNSVVFSVLPLPGGRAQALYRAVLPMRWLGKQKGVTAYLVNGVQPSVMDLPARSWHFSPFALSEWPLIDRLQQRGHPCYIAADDNYWAEQQWASDDPGAEEITRSLPDLEKLVRRIHGVIVTEPPLAEIIQRFNRNVTVIPNALPPLSELPPPRDPRLVQSVLRIGWTGSGGYKPDLEMIAEPLLRILAAYHHVRLLLQGDVITTARFAGHPQVERLEWVPIDRYLHNLFALDLSIFLGPMRDNPFNDCRSNLKALTAGALGAAFVGSRVGPFARTVLHGTTGLLVDNTQEAWYEALRTLIEEPALRRELGENGRGWVAEHGTIETTGPLWAKALGVELSAEAVINE